LTITKISVVTACFNAESYIEATIRSVLDQDYPALEYIIIDGGSTDSTVSIVNRYRDKISYFISEADDGQYSAIKKGLELSSGDVMCWLNADDVFMPWTLSVVGELFAEHVDVEWITGLPAFINCKGQMTAIYSSLSCYPQNFIANGWFDRNLGGFLQQENMFWRRSLWNRSDGLNLELSLAADFALWTSFAKHAPLVPVSVPLAGFRQLPGQQRSSVLSEVYDEDVASVIGETKSPPRLWRWIAGKGLVARSIIRLLIRRKSPAILYDNTSGSWRKIENRRSLARVHFQDLLNLSAVRTKR
jgi:hypothetical protein